MTANRLRLVIRGWSKDPDPLFFVVSDQYNDTYRGHRVETELRAISLGLLREVATMLERREGWTVYFAVRRGR